ncbi:MAG TPA: hypothetical protein VJJ22_01465 [Candidatus Paceibacterota bacterium]
MDILSHGLWAVATGKGAQLEKGKEERRWNSWWLLFWGMFPDLFAFAPIFAYSLISLVTGGGPMIHRPPTELEPWTPGFDNATDITQLLYSLSHSLVILAFVLIVFYIWKRKIPWIIFGWPLHILVDIPTHSYLFYPTPAFWPLWDWKLDGFSWGSGHFTLYNYVTLVLIFLGLYYLRKRRSAKK